MTTVLIPGRGLEALLAATGGHPFVRYDVSEGAAASWWQVEGAVAFHRSPRPDRVSVTLLGDDDGVLGLVDHLPTIGAGVERPDPRRRIVGVSLPQHLEPVLHQRFRVGQGGDWEWFWTASAPPPSRGEDRVVDLDDHARHRQITAFLAEHSPTADTLPGTGEVWSGIEDGDRLVAVAAVGPNNAGAPHLTSVAVDTASRGLGLGRALVGALTRRAVREHGVSTLGMYSHNTVARGLYRALGYDSPCAWSSRAVVLDG